MRFCGLFVLLLLGAGNAAAEVRAVDGDSLVAEGRRVRLLELMRRSMPRHAVTPGAVIIPAGGRHWLFCRS